MYSLVNSRMFQSPYASIEAVIIIKKIVPYKPKMHVMVLVIVDVMDGVVVADGPR